MRLKKILVAFFGLFFVWAYFVHAEWELRFYGAVGGEVAGSCYVLTNGTEAILIDCGSHMSEEIELEGDRAQIDDYCPFDFSGENIGAIIITHAHMDHIGRLHYFFLHHPDYRGPVFMTYVTKELYCKTLGTTIDYMKDGNGKDLDLRTKEHIRERLLKQIDVVDYLVAFSPAPNVSAYFVNTSHIPGSAAVVVNIVEGESVTTVTFSGDIGPGDHPFLPPLPLDIPAYTNTDILVVESTYGDVVRDQVAKEHELEDFYQTINSSYANNRLVIIPSFALDRTQRVLATILEGISQGKLPKTLKIAVGGASSKDYTEVYMDLMARGEWCREYFATTVCTTQPLNQGRFEFQRFNRAAELAKNYHVIITPSGMGSSSDAEVLLHRYLSDPNTLIVKVGWAPPDSPMGQLAAGK
ncbi:MAG: MBL fold metallo-hydrolase, partial [Candidatus Hadarchaeum sp.]|uniref:MBL fold metallo-hydrolase n=1 Tax=Candidatus Hadarchaeum sp. TaxID=2883567 RepID=UPI003171B1C9